MLSVVPKEVNPELNTVEPDALGKTTRVNLLFDFYGPLLTDKQRTFLEYYFHDDYSLGEIAAQFGISRQAVYEHIKRADAALEGYEQKLGLLARHEQRQLALARLEELTGRLDDALQQQELHDIVAAMRLVELTGMPLPGEGRDGEH